MARWILLGVGIVAAAVLLDRVLLWAERRGWVYWRRRKPSGTSLGTAMLSLQAFLEPTREHVVEERRRQQADIDVWSDDDPLDDDTEATDSADA